MGQKVSLPTQAYIPKFQHLAGRRGHGSRISTRAAIAFDVSSLTSGRRAKAQSPGLDDGKATRGEAPGEFPCPRCVVYRDPVLTLISLPLLPSDRARVSRDPRSLCNARGPPAL